MARRVLATLQGGGWCNFGHVYIMVEASIRPDHAIHKYKQKRMAKAMPIDYQVMMGKRSIILRAIHGLAEQGEVEVEGQGIGLRCRLPVKEKAQVTHIENAMTPQVANVLTSEWQDADTLLAKLSPFVTDEDATAKILQETRTEGRARLASLPMAEQVARGKRRLFYRTMRNAMRTGLAERMTDDGGDHYRLRKKSDE